MSILKSKAFIYSMTGLVIVGPAAGIGGYYLIKKGTDKATPMAKRSNYKPSVWNDGSSNLDISAYSGKTIFSSSIADINNDNNADMVFYEKLEDVAKALKLNETTDGYADLVNNKIWTQSELDDAKLESLFGLKKAASAPEATAGYEGEHVFIEGKEYILSSQSPAGALTTPGWFDITNGAPLTAADAPSTANIFRVNDRFYDTKASAVNDMIKTIATPISAFYESDLTNYPSDWDRPYNLGKNKGAEGDTVLLDGKPYQFYNPGRQNPTFSQKVVPPVMLPFAETNYTHEIRVEVGAGNWQTFTYFSEVDNPANKVENGGPSLNNSIFNYGTLSTELQNYAPGQTVVIDGVTWTKHAATDKNASGDKNFVQAFSDPQMKEYFNYWQASGKNEIYLTGFGDKFTDIKDVQEDMIVSKNANTHSIFSFPSVFKKADGTFTTDMKLSVAHVDAGVPQGQWYKGALADLKAQVTAGTFDAGRMSLTPSTQDSFGSLYMAKAGQSVSISVGSPAVATPYTTTSRDFTNVLDPSKAEGFRATSSGEQGWIDLSALKAVEATTIQSARFYVPSLHSYFTTLAKAQDAIKVIEVSGADLHAQGINSVELRSVTDTGVLTTTRHSYLTNYFSAKATQTVKDLSGAAFTPIAGADWYSVKSHGVNYYFSSKEKALNFVGLSELSATNKAWRFVSPASTTGNPDPNNGKFIMDYRDGVTGFTETTQKEHLALLGIFISPIVDASTKEVDEIYVNGVKYTKN